MAQFRWPRFALYTLHDERIAPVEGLKLEWHFPWKEYRRARLEQQPPYISLARLSRHLGADPKNLTDADRDAILAWTAKNGPLGLFHHFTVQIDDPGPGEDRKWSWGVGGWVPLPGWLAATKRPTVLVRRNWELQFEPADPHIALYFARRTRPRGALPQPDSEKFFNHYSEPLAVWLPEVKLFAATFNDRRWDYLNDVAGRASHFRSMRGDSVYSEIAFPSLLSALAEMCLQDLENGRVPRDCANCGELFVASRQWGSYCSRKCASVKRQQRFRQKHLA